MDRALSRDLERAGRGDARLARGASRRRDRGALAGRPDAGARGGPRGSRRPPPARSGRPGAGSARAARSARRTGRGAVGRATDPRGGARSARRVHALPSLPGPRADRVRRRQPGRGPDVRRRGTGRRGGPARAPLRRPRRRAPHQHDREGPRHPAQRGLHLQHRQVSAAREPDAARGRGAPPAGPSSTARSRRCSRA